MISLLFALLFIAIGVFMLIKVGGAALIIGVADILFGLVLIVSALISGRKKRGGADEAEEESPDSSELSDSNADGMDDAGDIDQDYFDSFDLEDDMTAEDAQEDPNEKLRRLSEVEAELKVKARRSVAEAKAAKEEAEELSAAAKDAEDRLVEAEKDMRLLVGAEQQAALKRVDQLANEARELSQRASVARKNARTAAAQARKAADEHSAAMDAAAQAMMELEELDFADGDVSDL